MRKNKQKKLRRNSQRARRETKGRTVLEAKCKRIPRREAYLSAGQMLLPGHRTHGPKTGCGV